MQAPPSPVRPLSPVAPPPVQAPPSPVRPPSPDAPPFPDSPALQPPTSPQEPFPLPNSPVTRPLEDDVPQRRFFVAAHTSPQDWQLLGETDNFLLLQIMVYTNFDATVPLVLRRGTVDFTENDFLMAEGDVHLIVQVKEEAGDNDDDNALPVFTETDEADRRAELERFMEEGDATGGDPFNDPLNFDIQGLQGGNPLATGWGLPQGEEDEEEFIERNDLPEDIVFPSGIFEWWSESERARFVNIVNNHPELPPDLVWPDGFFLDDSELSDTERERKISIYLNHVNLVRLGLDEGKYDLRFLDTSTKAPKPLTEAQLMAKARAEEKKREKQLIRAQKKREQEERARERKEAKVQREAAKNAKKLLKEQETIERQQEQAAMRERLKTMRKEDRDAYQQEYKERKRQKSEVSDEMISATPWGQANPAPPNGLLEIDESDIPQMLVDLLQSHINSLLKSGGTGYRHVYYQGGDNSKGYKNRGYSAYLSITGSNSHRIALTNNLMAAVIMIVAAKIDPRLLSQKSASIWLKWMIEHPGGTAAAIKEWLADETVQQNIGELPTARAHGGRPSGSAQQARDRRAQDPTYSEKDEMARLKSRKMNKKPKASSSAAGSSSSASVPIENEELPLLPPLPTEQPTRPMTDEEKRNMAVHLSELLGIGLNEALETLAENNFDLTAILGDEFVYEELGNDLEDILGEDLSDFE